MGEPRSRSRRYPAAERAQDGAEVTKTAQPSAVTVPSRSGRRALVVEADPAALQVCRDALESSGFHVDAVDSGIAAMVAARETLPDLILVDLQLRDVPGGEAIGWLRSDPALCSTPIIVLTANAVEDKEWAATQLGASLRKPLSLMKIQSAIREALN